MRICILCILCCALYFSCDSNKQREHIELVGVYEVDDDFVNNTLRYPIDVFTTQMFDSNSFNVVKFGYGILAEFMLDKLKEPKSVIDSLNKLDVYKKEEFIWKVFKANPHIADSINLRIVDIIVDKVAIKMEEKIANDPAIIEMERECDSIIGLVDAYNDSVFRSQTKKVW